MNRQEYHYTGHRMDYSEIDTRFEPYYDNGQRVEVEWKAEYEDFTGYGCRTEGRRARFYVGKSTGWRPVFIMLQNINSRGGVEIPSNAVESIRGLRGLRGLSGYRF